jgi:hypothetical protein
VLSCAPDEVLPGGSVIRRAPSCIAGTTRRLSNACTRRLETTLALSLAIAACGGGGGSGDGGGGGGEVEAARRALHHRSPLRRRRSVGRSGSNACRSARIHPRVSITRRSAPNPPARCSSKCCRRPTRDSSVFCTDAASITRNLTADSGWPSFGGNTYSGTRASAPARGDVHERDRFVTGAASGPPAICHKIRSGCGNSDAEQQR